VISGREAAAGSAPQRGGTGVIRGLEPREMLRGALIYSLGDTAGMLIRGEFVLTRALALALIGGTLYAREVPAWFRWIDRRFPRESAADGRGAGRAGDASGDASGAASGAGVLARWRRALAALLYFNPLWIARHLLFLKLGAGLWSEITPALLLVGARSFAVNLPLTALGNYVIQNRLPARQRFAASAIFSSLMAVSYALCEVLLR